MAYANDTSQFKTADNAAKKPCIAIMGEFSVGKSTFCNLVLGGPVLPMKVTATQLPPVWISYGTDAPVRIDHDGAAHPLDIEKISSIRPADTAYIKLNKQSDLLGLCDVIDMPGISDPNMSAEVWQNVIENADAVIWCTHATQAWRQSESATWSNLPERLRANGLLMVTRFDKLTTDRDRRRVMQRIEKETEGLFRGIFPISLRAAVAAGDDAELLRACGAEQMAHALVNMLYELGGDTTAVEPDNLFADCLWPETDR